MVYIVIIFKYVFDYKLIDVYWYVKDIFLLIV